jgi:hypothetical protein
MKLTPVSEPRRSGLSQICRNWQPLAVALARRTMWRSLTGRCGAGRDGTGRGGVALAGTGWGGVALAGTGRRWLAGAVWCCPDPGRCGVARPGRCTAASARDGVASARVVVKALGGDLGSYG